VTPVEMWDLPLRGKPLQGWRRDAAFPHMLASRCIGFGGSPRDVGLRARDRARRIDAIYVTGGAAMPLDLDGPVILARDPVFAAARASSILVPGTIGVDVGQTSIKVAHGDVTLRIERDLSRAPMRDDVPHESFASSRASTLDFLRDALAPLSAWPSHDVVLALPCALSPEPASCTYCWHDGDPELLGVLAQSVRPKRLHVLNDAEWPPPPRMRSARSRRDHLVLTLGFGVGAALLEKTALPS